MAAAASAGSEMLLIPSPKTAADLQSLVHALLNQQYDSQGLVFRHVSSIHFETEEELPCSVSRRAQS